MDKRVTLNDIAKAAGVSKNTVSIVLRDRPGVSDSVRQRVLSLARDMNYERHPSQTVAAGKPKCIMILLPDSIGMYIKGSTAETIGLIPRLYFKLQLYAQQSGCIVVPYALSLDEEKKCILPPMLTSMAFTGVATMGCFSADYLKALIDTGLNVVTVHEYIDGVESNAVTSDDVYAGYVMTEHLIQMGHRNIIYLGEKYYMAKYMDRWQGYCRAMSKHGLPIENNRYSETPVHAQREEPEHKMLSETLSMQHPMPTAIVCGEDFTAYRTSVVLKQMGYRVPEDVSLVGFDDVYRDDHNHDTYTSYRVDQDEIAQSALDLLLKPDRKPRKVIIYGEPVFRDSVRRIET